jgi:hypothetical protein
MTARKPPLKPTTDALDPDATLRAVRQAAPELPPATATPEDRRAMFSVRMMESSIVAFAHEAMRLGLTQRRLLAQLFKAAGIPVATDDLVDRPLPRRRTDPP